MTRENTLNIDGLKNARHLGNLQTLDGKTTRDTLIRSDNLTRLTEAGKTSLLESGISLILDVRAPHELKVDAPPFKDHPAVKYLNLPLADDANEAARMASMQARSMKDVYQVMVTHFKTEIGRAMKAIADAPEGKVLVHCHAGKDRTGIVIALALSLVGVPDEVIAADYALTDENMAEIYQEMLEREPDPRKQAFMKAFMVSPPEAMLGLLDHLRTEYGGTAEYLQACGLTDEDLDRIRGRLVG
ncbi:tyrosine-protein phosphatase [Deinococcus cellulosilyticus]|uniref:Protein-tyrosine-phosphatase n=1 Tax=Deinococcus cellulosilyticus (strain DSM 18568 / NBRC 106333 / KACC 11606 / 5516J-15) TaxID=1223518 RepID=A0A511N5G4_DEIC1|nr:tyrosine-protein phosphatase [Deinococcus cellulosilyticus]GEM48099.1 protein-tyrosine-phosphatase [Deinococcus cellulosilyticus NBRC 106333 = KACC 11606]